MAKRESDIMEFLILLKDDDYNSCPLAKSFYEKTIKVGKDLPGVLHISNLLDINSRAVEEESREEEDKREEKAEKMSYGRREPKYVIKRMALPKVTYIKLPKEKLYVRADDWEFEYMKSQIQEIIMICGLLGAKKVSYDITQNVEEHKSVGANLDMGDLVSGVGFGAKLSRGSEVGSQLTGEVEFEESEDLDVSFESLEREERWGNIHYLTRLPQWMSMVDNRIRRRVSSTEFKYSYSRELFINADLISKVRGMGITFDYGSNRLSNFSVMFQIEYYPFPEKNEDDRVVSSDSLKGIDLNIYEDPDVSEAPVAKSGVRKSAPVAPDSAVVCDGNKDDGDDEDRDDDDGDDEDGDDEDGDDE